MVAHLLCVSHYCGVIRVVGLRGGLGRHLLFLPALKDEGPCSRADIAGLLWSEVALQAGNVQGSPRHNWSLSLAGDAPVLLQPVLNIPSPDSTQPTHTITRQLTAVDKSVGKRTADLEHLLHLFDGQQLVLGGYVHTVFLSAVRCHLLVS